MLNRYSLPLVAGLIAVLAQSPALADQAVQHADVVCSQSSEVAVVRFGMGWNNDPPHYATLPVSVDGGLSSEPPSTDRTCRLPDGREITVTISQDDTLNQGLGGGDPAGYFTLVIGGKPVLTKQQWKPRGFTESTWISGVVVIGGTPFLCLRPSQDAATKCEALPATNEIDDRRDAELLALFQKYCGIGSLTAAGVEEAAKRDALLVEPPPPGLDKYALPFLPKVWTIRTSFAPAHLLTMVVDRPQYHGESCKVDVPLMMGEHLIDLMSRPDAYGMPQSRGGYADLPIEQINWTGKTADRSKTEAIRVSKTSANGAGLTSILRIVATPRAVPPVKQTVEDGEPRN